MRGALDKFHQSVKDAADARSPLARRELSSIAADHFMPRAVIVKRALLSLIADQERLWQDIASGGSTPAVGSVSSVPSVAEKRKAGETGGKGRKRRKQSRAGAMDSDTAAGTNAHDVQGNAQSPKKSREKASEKVRKPKPRRKAKAASVSGDARNTRVNLTSHHAPFQPPALVESFDDVYQNVRAVIQKVQTGAPLLDQLQDLVVVRLHLAMARDVTLTTHQVIRKLNFVPEGVLANRRRESVSRSL